MKCSSENSYSECWLQKTIVELASYSAVSVTTRVYRLLLGDRLVKEGIYMETRSRFRCKHGFNNNEDRCLDTHTGRS